MTPWSWGNRAAPLSSAAGGSARPAGGQVTALGSRGPPGKDSFPNVTHHGPSWQEPLSRSYDEALLEAGCTQIWLLLPYCAAPPLPQAVGVTPGRALRASKNQVAASYCYSYEPNCHVRTHLMQHAAAAWPLAPPPRCTSAIWATPSPEPQTLQGAGSGLPSARCRPGSSGSGISHSPEERRPGALRGLRGRDTAGSGVQVQGGLAHPLKLLQDPAGICCTEVACQDFGDQLPDGWGWRIGRSPRGAFR